MGSYHAINSSFAVNNTQAIKKQLADSQARADSLCQRNDFLERRLRDLNNQLRQRHTANLNASTARVDSSTQKKLETELCQVRQQLNAAIKQQEASAKENTKLQQYVRQASSLGHQNRQLISENLRLREEIAQARGYTIHKNKESAKAATKSKGVRKEKTSLDGFVVHDEDVDDEEEYAMDCTDKDVDEGGDDDDEMLDIATNATFDGPTTPQRSSNKRRYCVVEDDFETEPIDAGEACPRKTRKASSKASACIARQYENTEWD